MKKLSITLSALLLLVPTLHVSARGGRDTLIGVGAGLAGLTAGAAIASSHRNRSIDEWQAYAARIEGKNQYLEDENDRLRRENRRLKRRLRP